MAFSRHARHVDWKNTSITVSGVSHDGRGVARHQGKALFVTGALPGEEITVQPLKHHKTFIDTRVRQIRSASSERIQPEYAHFGRCGGCSLQYWFHEGQLAGKQRIVLDQIRRFSAMEPEQIAPPLVSSAYGYRHRCRLGIKWEKGQLQLGLKTVSCKLL